MYFNSFNEAYNKLRTFPGNIAFWSMAILWTVSVMQIVFHPNNSNAFAANNIPSDYLYREKINSVGEGEVKIIQGYFDKAKEEASFGTMARYEESITLYEMALQLAPDFSSALAEMAYSFASIAYIIKTGREDNNTADKFFTKAEEAIKKASDINKKNPNVFAVKTIIDYYTGNEKGAKENLESAISRARSHGTSERVFQAMAMLEKDKTARVSYLLEFDKIAPDSAELHNILGLAYYQIGNRKRAKKLFIRARDNLNPAYDEAYLNLALVSDNKKQKAIYKEISAKQCNFQQKAQYYKTILYLQWWLSLGFIVIIICCVVVIRSLTGFILCMICMVLSYTGFELLIHIYYPVNAITHAFPINFPFF